MILLGLNPKLIHPRNLILSVFPVMPPCSRPYVIQDGNYCDDDITNQLIEIIKINKHLEVTNLPEVKLQKYIQSLKFRIATTYNNSGSKAKHTTNGRPIKGIKERLTGKSGQIRDSLLGKRCEKTGRTVIGPEPTLKMNQLAIPKEIAENLTIPVNVTSFNLEELNRLVEDGFASYILKNKGKTRINLKYALNKKGTKLKYGDKIYRGNGKVLTYINKNIELEIGDFVERDGAFLCDIEYPKKRKYNLEVGDIVERHLIDGDVVLLNRQPTLHSGSMMAQEIVVRDFKTFRFNLAICKSFNSDFDGDEMNIHIPQSLEAQAELKMICASKNMLVSPQTSKTNFAVVQDSLLAAYKMTLGLNPIRKQNFFDISLVTHLTSTQVLAKMQRIRRVMKEKGKKAQCFHGKGLFSLLLPDDLIYENANKCDPLEPILKIYKGVLYEGAVNKAIIGSAHNSLILVLNKEYGVDVAVQFIDNVQFITNAWNLVKGFSVGLKDCLITNQEQVIRIQDVVEKCYIEAEGIKDTTSHAGIKEVRITAALSKAKDIGLRIAKESLDAENNFLSTVLSGSKGDFFNIAQVRFVLLKFSIYFFMTHLSRRRLWACWVSKICWERAFNQSSITGKDLCRIILFKT